MKDEPVEEQERIALSARRQRLSEKQRALLDALLLQNGIDIDQPVRPDDNAKAGDPDRREHERPAGSNGQSGASASPLVVMRSSGSKIPFFCVHALLGSVFHYHRLASLMDKEQPFYGLQAPGLDASETPLDTVDGFAQLYLRSVREIQPSGPYKLGGYSFGSWIAFQMASRLVEQGEEVGFVAILGTDVPLSVSMPWVYDQVSFFSQYWQDYERNILQPFLSYQERMKRAPEEESSKDLPPLLRVVMAHNRAALRFEPKPYAGKLILFETLDQQSRTPLDASRGWKRLSTQPVETHLVSGNHLSMLDEPHVQDLAEKLTRCLNRG
jgi:thioesterase domain-containing protein